jgi:ribose transport system substrate-binding protein
VPPQTHTRRVKILELIRAEGFCSVVSLAKALNVSEVTIRTDLSALENEKLITRIHGGAVLANEGLRGKNFEERIRVNEDKKRWIARYAAELVVDYDSLILDASTTAYYMAEYLAEREGLTVFTNGVEVAFRLAKNPSNKIILTGGLLRPLTASVVAEFGNSALNGVHVRKAFLSGTGWSPELELMDDDLFEVQMKKSMVDSAETVIAIVDSTKFGRPGLASFVQINDISRVITDSEIDEAHLSTLRQAGAHVILCSDHATRVFKADTGSGQVRLGFANLNDTIPFSMLVRQGMVQAASANHIDLLLTDNCEDGPTALANVEYFIEEGVDLVVEFNIDARFGNVIMERLRAAKIPVIAIDIPLPGATFVGVDNYKAGLMAGSLIGHYVAQRWGGVVDKVLVLELPLSGPVPAARMQGQLDGLRSRVQVDDDDIIHLDSKNTFEGARQAVAQVLPALKAAQRIVVLCINDEVALGAQTAFEEAGSQRRMVTVSLGADSACLKELQRPGSRVIGAVAFFPERYGETIVSIALQILQSKPVPPAVCTDHKLVLPADTMRTLDLSAMPYDTLTVEEYAAMQSGETAAQAAGGQSQPTIQSVSPNRKEELAES